MDLLKAKTVNQCIDIATADALGDDEVASGWENCLEEVFEDVEVTLAGQCVALEGFDTMSGTLRARCRFKRRKLRVTLDSLELVNPTAPQRVWLKAFLRNGRVKGGEPTRSLQTSWRGQFATNLSQTFGEIAVTDGKREVSQVNRGKSEPPKIKAYFSDFPNLFDPKCVLSYLYGSRQ